MQRRQPAMILTALAMAVLSDSALAQSARTYSDYLAIQNRHVAEQQRIDNRIREANEEFRTAQRSYRSSCKSPKWQVVFEANIPTMIEELRFLESRNKAAYESRRSSYNEWLKEFKSEFKNNPPKPETDITVFYIWYSNLISTIEQDAFVIQARFADGMVYLSNIYENMTLACQTDDPTALETETVVNVIEGIFDRLISLTNAFDS